MLFACRGNVNKSATQLWEEGQEYRINENLKESITSFKSIILKYPDHDLSAEAQFQIADIFLNDTKDFEYAVKEFKIVVDKYPNHVVAKKSLFMIAYIYNNYINSYSEAIAYYNLFSKKYPNDELMPSVNFELNSLIEIENQIDSLNSIVNTK